MGLKIDLGCGNNKKEGYIGVDILDVPEVDYVTDLSKKPLPFDENSVEAVYSNHFFEHIADPSPIFQQIGRVAINGAQLEFWTPYAFSNSAFIFDQKYFPTEEPYMHICVKFVDFWEPILYSRWLFKEVCYIVNPETLNDLRENNINLNFAIKYYKEIVQEFGVFIEVRKNYNGPIVMPKRTFATHRGSDHVDLTEFRFRRFPYPLWIKSIFQRFTRAFQK